MSSAFEWPWQYSFPPFYTLQPNANTRQKQLEAWCDFVLSYYRHNKLFTMNVTEMEISPLFNNKQINRKLSAEFINIILDELRKRGNVEWTDKGKKQCLVMWRSPEEWGKLIYKWAMDTGHINSICTLYEITNGEDTTGEEFCGLEKWLLVRSLKNLELQRKAELMMFDKNEGALLPLTDDLEDVKMRSEEIYDQIHQLERWGVISEVYKLRRIYLGGWLI